MGNDTSERKGDKNNGNPKASNKRTSILEILQPVEIHVGLHVGRGTLQSWEIPREGRTSLKLVRYIHASAHACVYVSVCVLKSSESCVD